MSLPRSLVHLKREITEKKWHRPRRGLEARNSRKNYTMIPKSQRSDGAVAGSPKRLRHGSTN